MRETPTSIITKHVKYQISRLCGQHKYVGYFEVCGNVGCRVAQRRMEMMGGTLHPNDGGGGLYPNLNRLSDLEMG
jgi:hypothetical protein